MPIDLTYPALLALFGEHAMKQPNESRQMLAWFLENYYRLDETEVLDTIVDRSGDHGIDGVYANEELEQLDVFQAKIKQKEAAVGEGSLRGFWGGYEQVTTAEGIQHILDTAPKTELAKRLKEIDAKQKVIDGYEVRAIFLCNLPRDQSATDYLTAHPAMTLYDRGHLEKQYTPLDEITPIATPITFSTEGVDRIVYEIEAGTTMVIAPLAASELIQMEGITSGELFAPNVRQWLGKNTKVNKDLAKSIEAVAEHKLFPAFHNGITVLCQTLDTETDSVRIAGYGVVNGCQSVRGLYEKQASITPNLRILTKLIAVSPTTALAAKITDHSNNQNGIKTRDLKSNHHIQRRLKDEFHQIFPDEIYYRTKTGEHPEWNKSKVLDNELAGRILLAYDLRKPESCHQAFKVFDELYKDIFGRPEVTANRIVALYDLYKIILSKLPLMTDPLFGDYSLTRFFILYLARETLDLNERGKQFFADPAGFMNAPNGRSRLNATFTTLVGDLVTMLDTEVEARNDPEDQEIESFDFKRELKSKAQVNKLKTTILGQYRVSVRNGHTKGFAALWADSENP